jgi:hypothetical protein
MRDQVLAILRAYQAGQLDFEDAREELELLDGAAAAEVLAAFDDPRFEAARDVCVMVLADVLYPPAYPLFRRLLDHPDVEAMAIPAAVALDGALGGAFDSERLHDLSGAECAARIARIGAAWDRGQGRLPSVDAWLEARRRERRAQEDEEPPPSPALAPAQTAALRPAVIELRKRVDALAARDLRGLHALELRALSRVLPILAAFAPADRRVLEALDAVRRFLAGELGDDALARAHEQAAQATRDAHAAARWNRVHGRYQVPAARAAAYVAQGATYLASPEARNRLQALHAARDALEWSGAGRAVVEAELTWQLAEVARLLGSTSR